MDLQGELLRFAFVSGACRLSECELLSKRRDLRLQKDDSGKIPVHRLKISIGWGAIACYVSSRIGS